MYFSKQQIEQSIERLSKLNPFFGITFLAFKKVGLPVGSTIDIDSVQILRNFLLQYYSPLSGYAGFYTPFTPTKNSRQHWKSATYPETLHSIADRNQTLRKALDHPGGGNWGWQKKYVNELKLMLKDQQIPTFDLAVWLFRLHLWPEKVREAEIIDALFKEFTITDQEQVLFDTSVPHLANPLLQNQPVSTDDLLSIIGFPPDHRAEGAALRVLKLTGVGPATKIELDLAPRLNLIAGDNGLGKTFLLECAWWALTGMWSGYPARPRQDVDKDEPKITFSIERNGVSDKEQTARYNWDQLKWITPSRRNVLPGLCLYSQSDGSFAVWDPAKHILAGEERYSGREADALTRFSRSEVWNGVREPDQYGRIVRAPSNGLIYDWVRWQEAADQTRFRELETALLALSPDPEKEILVPGTPTRMSEIGDERDIPTLRFPYGDVPILLCSAGIQRIVALAYLLIWAWQNHVRTAESMRRQPERSIVLLIDEMEAHLHPFWQRAILPALLKVVQELAPEVEVQMIITTHSPLVLASLESLFDEERDSIFHLYSNQGEVQLDAIPFIKRGRVDQWLISDIFGLAQPRSRDAEQAIEAAKQLQKERTPPREKVQAVSERLKAVLAQDDDFWPRWTYFAEQRGVRL